MIKTFRGQLKNDGKEVIRLSTNQGLVGYHIVKFQVLPSHPEGATTESLLTIWSTEAARDAQVGVGTIDFTCNFGYCAKSLLSVVNCSFFTV